MKIKYPRTFHLPWSQSITSDDKRLCDTSCFEGKTVIVTEKMDGENTTMGRDYIHARSLDGRDHVSRSWVKQLHASVSYKIPQGWRVCGENLFAKHSIGYDSLDSYFLVFSIWNEKQICLSWEDTVAACELFGLHHVKVLLYPTKFNDAVIQSISVDTAVSEGYVLRNADEFHHDDFRSNCAKFVRANHVQTDEHWSLTKIMPNGLKSATY